MKRVMLGHFVRGVDVSGFRGLARKLMDGCRPPGSLGMNGKEAKEVRHLLTDLAVRRFSHNPPKLRRQWPDFGIDREKQSGEKDRDVSFSTIQR